MRLVRPTLVTVVATAVVAAVLTAAPASAETAPDRDLRRDGHHFPYTTEASVPPGGYASITTPALPKTAKVLTVKVAPPADSSDADDAAFKDITQTLATMSKKKRLLTCLEFHKFVMSDMDSSDYAQINEDNAVVALLILGACLQAAGLLSPDRPPAKATAVDKAKAKSCERRPFALPAELTKVDGGYHIDVEGNPSTPKRPKLRVSCHVKGLAYTYKVRAAKKGTPLRQVVGKRMGIGLRSPGDAERVAPAKVTFALP